MYVITMAGGGWSGSSWNVRYLYAWDSPSNRWPNLQQRWLRMSNRSNGVHPMEFEPKTRNILLFLDGFIHKAFSKKWTILGYSFVAFLMTCLIHRAYFDFHSFFKNIHVVFLYISLKYLPMDPHLCVQIATLPRQGIPYCSGLPRQGRPPCSGLSRQGLTAWPDLGSTVGLIWEKIKNVLCRKYIGVSLHIFGSTENTNSNFLVKLLKRCGG